MASQQHIDEKIRIIPWADKSTVEWQRRPAQQSTTLEQTAQSKASVDNLADDSSWPVLLEPRTTLSEPPTRRLVWRLHPRPKACSPSNIDPERAFTCFSALPSELRLMIWHEAFDATSTLRPPTIRQIPHSPYMAKEPSPVLTRVNRESRSESRKFYKIQTITFLELSPPMVLFFNPGVYTLFLDTKPRPEDYHPRHPAARCYCAEQAGTVEPCLCTIGRQTPILWPAHLPSPPPCPCPHASLMARQMHFLTLFYASGTRRIAHIALHVHATDRKWAVQLPVWLSMAFWHATRVTLVVHPETKLPDLAEAWSVYREPFVQYRRYSGWSANMRLWVADEVWRCWWRLGAGEARTDWRQESRKGAVKLDHLLEAGL
ncbi:hypothetical protein BU26DRAFT_117827 [Trematosphaeria pertusa]|uniref:2EXR domain-containing protein n=1 Tax=Trematosphaeria pertusa TaxID=390896 RepID=A0A6A6I0D7_9PLEO|nr:uncharacterized protein BU26DRAFT_117827 [Trematosphaeria pertusa]KAF2243442.1 hypothetical protein BU26DRAFT_117827 [Trematosphaeria pertusa]